MQRTFLTIAFVFACMLANASDWVLQKTITEGKLTPLCVPVLVTAADFDELYAVASIVNGNCEIYPVDHIDAGIPCVVRCAATRTTTMFTDVVVSADKPAEYVLPWQGGSCTGDYSSYTWHYTTLLGSVGTPTQLKFRVCDLMDMDFYVSLQNINVSRFLTQTRYDFATTSQVEQFNRAPLARRDIPNPVTLPLPATSADKYVVSVGTSANYTGAATMDVASTAAVCEVYNLVPGITYFYKVEADGVVVSGGRFHVVANQLRMIYAPSISNIRDLGGWPTQDGRRVKYGRIYRGGELNGQHVATAADIQTLKSLGVTAEIDLRWATRPEEDFRGVSAYGFSEADGTFYYVDGNDWLASDFDAAATRAHLKREIEMIISTLRNGGGIYFHCVWGADRTGFLAMLLEGALGLLPDAIFKDYELTTFSIAGLRSKQNFGDRINYFNAYAGATLSDRVTNYLTTRLGISRDDIDYLRSTMLE